MATPRATPTGGTSPRPRSSVSSRKRPRASPYANGRTTSRSPRKNVHAVAGVTPTQSRVAALRAQSATLTPSACSERRACARAGLSGERIGLAVLSRSTMQGQTACPPPRALGIRTAPAYSGSAPPPQRTMRYSARHGASKFLLASVAVLLLSSVCLHRLGYQVLPQEAPPARNAEVARSVWRTFSLEAPEFHVFGHELRQLSQETHRGYRQDVFSLGRHGQLFPKHSVLPGVVGALSYVLFGDAGFWILQQILALLLFYSTFRMTSLVAKRESGVLTLTSIALLSETLIGFFCYVFSYDLHGLVLLVCGLHLMYCRPL